LRPSIQSISYATAMILDGVADRDAVMALSAMTASPLDAVQHRLGGAAD